MRKMSNVGCLGRRLGDKISIYRRPTTLVKLQKRTKATTSEIMTSSVINHSFSKKIIA